jgi:ribosomal protein S18 acetylase RimI-like enzyme
MLTEIRHATPADLPQLAGLFNQYRVFYQQLSDEPAALAFLTERMEQKQSVILVAESSGQLAGFTQLYPIFSSVGMQRSWLLNDLFVSPYYRRQGIAEKLLEAARQHGLQTGSRWLLLQTGHDNAAAQALYEKNGWLREEDLFYRLDLK